MEMLTTKEFAEKVGMTYGRINQLIKSGELEADRIGWAYAIDPKFIEEVRNRPERRGRPRKSKKTAGITK